MSIEVYTDSDIKHVTNIPFFSERETSTMPGFKEALRATDVSLRKSMLVGMSAIYHTIQQPEVEQLRHDVRSMQLLDKNGKLNEAARIAINHTELIDIPEISETFKAGIGVVALIAAVSRYKDMTKSGLILEYSHGEPVYKELIGPKIALDNNVAIDAGSYLGIPYVSRATIMTNYLPDVLHKRFVTLIDTTIYGKNEYDIPDILWKVKTTMDGTSTGIAVHKLNIVETTHGDDSTFEELVDLSDALITIHDYAKAALDDTK